MRKLIIFFFLLTSGIFFCQFTVTGNSTNWNEMGRYIHAVKLYQNSEKTKAKIWYLDYNTVMGKTNVLSPSTDYEFEFSTEPDTLDKLYDLITQKLKDKQTEIVTLQFPEGEMLLSFYKGVGGHFMSFVFNNSSAIIDKNSTVKRETYGLNQNRLNKLFGKKNK